MPGLRRSLLSTLLGVSSIVTLASGQNAQRPAATAPPLGPDALYHRGADAWDAGNYPDALRDLQVVMKSAAAADYRDRVAQLTGELFVTTELTTDGRNPKIAPNGQFASYETGPATRPVTRIVRLANGAAQTVADLPAVSGNNVAFDPSSTRVVYLRATPNAELTAATAALDAAASAQDRQTAQAAVTALVERGEFVVRDLASGTDRVIAAGNLLKSTPTFSGDGRDVLFIGADPGDLSRADVYAVSIAGADPQRLTDQPGFKSGVLVDPAGAALVYTPSAASPFRGGGPAGAGRAGGAGAGAGRGARGGAPGAAAAPGSGQATGAPPPAPTGPNPCGGGRGGGTPAFAVVDLKAKTTRQVTGSAPVLSADGRTIAWLSRNDNTCQIQSAPTLGTQERTLHAGTRLDAPALSPDGTQVAYQAMSLSNDWEIFASNGTTDQRLSRDIRHDVLPRFLTATTVLWLTGEPRDRRSYLYDLSTGSRTRLFGNNTIRTIAPEYVWVPSGDGRHLIIQAERDGDTISPERGIYVVDLTEKVSLVDLRARLDRQLAAETELRQRETKAYDVIAGDVRKTVAGISTARIYEYEKSLVDFDTKYVGRPGNLKAIDYLTDTYKSFGYTPEQQWFSPAQAQGGKTANVFVTLKGTENPELIYVVGSHFDSVQAGPGADDDTTGTCALLEAARVLHGTPMPATIVFASFTGEEAGDLGSHEFVRLAAAAKWNVVGALNNDMIGWAAESARMDNTIRYSNAGIRDLQHGAAFLFSRLITYDAKYYKGTDASAFFDGWGDIVGGLGSYPVLGNPNYHQATDTIETVNFQQIAETSKVTAATLMYLASSPSRVKDLSVAPAAAGLKATWTASPEKGVVSYIVAYGPATDPLKTRVTVTGPAAALPALPPGTQVSVKAVNRRGLEGWDWARVQVR